MPQMNKKQSGVKIFSFQQMRDYIHVFVQIDNDLDGFITMEDFKKYFGVVMGTKQVHELFWDPSKFEFRKIEIAEFLEIMKPKECIIIREVVRTQVREYLLQLMHEKKNELIDKGIYDIPALKVKKVPSKKDEQGAISIENNTQV